MSFIQYDSHTGQCWSCQYPQCRTCDNAFDPYGCWAAHTGHQPPGRCRLAAVSLWSKTYSRILIAVPLILVYSTLSHHLNKTVFNLMIANHEGHQAQNVTFLTFHTVMYIIL